MSDHQRPPRKSTGAYEVGYAKPPRHTRFAKGQSGNPKGRPRGAVSLASLLTKILEEKMVIVENGRRRKMPNREIVLRQLMKRQFSVTSAASG